MTREQYDWRVTEGKAKSLYYMDKESKPGDHRKWHELPTTLRAKFIEQVKDVDAVNILESKGWQVYTGERPRGCHKYYLITYRIKTRDEMWSRPDLFKWEFHWTWVQKHMDSRIMILPVEGIY